MKTCRFCGVEFTNNKIRKHEIFCESNPNKHLVQDFFKDNPNKGLNKFTRAYLLGEPRPVTSEETKKKISRLGKPHTEETKLKLSKINKNNPKITGKASTPEKEKERVSKITEYAKKYNGGYRKGSGYGKKGWYYGIHCDSSWELAFVFWHVHNNISIKRCTQVRKYIFDGIEQNYHPDFVVNDNIYMK